MKFSISRRRSLRQLAAGALAVKAGAALVPLAAQAQSPITRIVVPFPPGGSTDLLGRRLAEYLATALGHPVIVENRAGAGGTVGADYVAKAAPDGHTLLLGVTGSNAIAQSLYPNLPYHVLKDFAPVSMVVSAPLVVSVHPSVKAQTLAEFVALAKARPDAISFGSAGNGTSMHLTGEMFKIATGAGMVHVPYRGNGGVMSDLMGGQIEATFGDLLVLQPHLEAGKMRALAVTSLQRNPLLPHVPTVAESGYPGFEALSWQGVFAPAGTPPAVVQKLSAEIARGLKSPAIQDYFAPRGFKVEGTTPQAFKAFVEAETAKWSRIVKASGAQPG
ncbi:tripartite tricarboxylate transporter substrate binding protein [Xenophilus arseniciresistens]|uniref:Tripartite tricarboxylate transporter substrate binding protein n=1 Tax=Xenophilus arseniciresistens TaxID=1283306 RepID=A0AAE3NAI0_9BURK|nr:tripartite tricarboxylate transporter substrate binding protein [Xenophilus arseniciresistens]MDA7417803.1 tripartite tricarboxylate transporter substrate binding protein [Xenophilus arseniciresistens]